MTRPYRTCGKVNKAGLMTINERRQYVLDRVAAGATVKEVAFELGISQARGHQIFHEALRIGYGYWHVWDSENNFYYGDSKVLKHSPASFRLAQVNEGG